MHRMANVVLQPPGEHRSRRNATASRSLSCRSTSSSASPVDRREKVPRKHRKLFDQGRHVNSGEALQSFDSLMVITFKMIIELHERDIPIMGALNHGLMLAEKSASGAYLDKAGINYDASVRSRAKKFGVEAFGITCNEDLLHHYSLENSRKFDAQKSASHKKKKGGICFRFNSDMGCHSKDCIFAHKCSLCKFEGHSMKSCLSADKGKPSK